MKSVIIIFVTLYIGAIAYVYFTQDSHVFEPQSIEKKAPVDLENVEHISFKIEDGVTLDGVYRKSSTPNAPLIVYYGGNADDATRIVLHVKELKGFDIVAFNYRGYVNSTGKPSQDAVFSDALRIFDKYGKDREVIVIGRSLGTGVATYVASKRDAKGLILITPYDSIVSIAKKMYPYFPIEMLSKHKFESVKYMLNVEEQVCLIEVENDGTIPKYHFDKLREVVPHEALHVVLSNTTHKDVLTHPDFEKTLEKMIKIFYVN